MPVEFSRPHVVVGAGPNGSGKSSPTRRLQSEELSIPFPERYINADEFAVELREAGDAHPERSAFHVGRTRRQDYREAGETFAYETVLSHPSGLVDLFLLRQAGFPVTLIVVTTADPEINVMRVRGRVRSGGHSVPEDRIRKPYQRFHLLLPAAVEFAHKALVFDSTDRIRLCLRLDNGVPGRGGSPPPYLKELLVDTLAQRADYRLTLGADPASPNAPFGADLSDGTYEGRLGSVRSTSFI